MMSFMNLLKILPSLFVFKRTDYRKYVPQGGAEQMMRENWTRVGSRLQSAMETVASDNGKVIAEKESA